MLAAETQEHKTHKILAKSVHITFNEAFIEQLWQFLAGINT